MFERMKLNIDQIGKTSFAIAGVLFTVLSIALSLTTWEDIGIRQLSVKILFVLGIAVASLLSAICYIYWLKRSNVIWNKGPGKITIRYGDIIKFAFPRRNKKKRIVVIPVNTGFDTIVDEDIVHYSKPLISPRSIHGMWLQRMFENGKDVHELDADIERCLENEQPDYILTSQQKERGKLECYRTGTIVPVAGEENVTYFMLALSDLDENNNAYSSKENVVECAKRLLEYCDMHGQGYSLYLPLLGTGFARAGLLHEDSLRILKAVLQLYSEKIRGGINIVIYNKDKKKVSLFD